MKVYKETYETVEKALAESGHKLSVFTTCVKKRRLTDGEMAIANRIAQRITQLEQDLAEMEVRD